jgi:predicted DNA-binding transcriptional regulator AlpA
MSELPELPEAIVRRRLLNTDQVAAFLGKSVPEVRRLLDKGLLPPPFRMDGRRFSWTLGTILDHIDSKSAA